MRPYATHAAGGLLPVLLLAVANAAGAAPAVPATEILVTASRQPVAPLDLAGNTARLDGDRIGLIDHTHIHELGTQVPGLWLSRGTGQEHLTAIRSPVLTGAGSCGSFLFLEDGLPIRPAGFCNVNELFEVASEQAAALEVIRGPANALYGSNGLHGTLNVLLPAPGSRRGTTAGLTAGPDRFLRGKFLWDSGPGDSAWLAGLTADRDDSFRDSAGHRQAKGFLKYAGPFAGGQLQAGLTATVLDQDTAGFIVGRDAYRDAAARRTNENPDSYRKADAQRAWARYTPGGAAAGDDARPDWELIGFLRRSEMDFLQHFLPGQPTEENGQVSGGLTFLRHGELGRASYTAGVDVELAEGFLREVQTGPQIGTPPRPSGRHYDYEVRQYLAATYAQVAVPLAGPLELVGGLRVEWLRYDYDNRMLAGDTRDDGTPCVPGPCLFNRPPDREDDFGNVAPNLGLLYRLGESASAWLTYTRGFRAPQAAELYRLQAGQAVADLDSEVIDSLELGVRWQGERVAASLAAFGMEKEDYILQDSNRFNVSNGESRHVGVEADVLARHADGWYAGLAATWARQTYRFDAAIPGGETIRSGNDIDTAPRTLGSLHGGYEGERFLAELEWVHQGRYYLTAGEAQRYPGHDLLNFRTAWAIDPSWSVTIRVNNLTDELYADRADFAFGNYRYFPGRDREAFVELTWRSR